MYMVGADWKHDVPGVRARSSPAPAHQARTHSHRLRHGPVRHLRSSLFLLYITGTVCQLTKLGPILTASDMDQYVSSDLLLSYFQCSGSGSTGSTCFWASRIH